jgi:hypothetical protein
MTCRPNTSAAANTIAITTRSVVRLVTRRAIDAKSDDTRDGRTVGAETGTESDRPTMGGGESALMKLLKGGGLRPVPLKSRIARWPTLFQSAMRRNPDFRRSSPIRVRTYPQTDDSSSITR